MWAYQTESACRWVPLVWTTLSLTFSTRGKIQLAVSPPSPLPQLRCHQHGEWWFSASESLASWGIDASGAIAFSRQLDRRNSIAIQISRRFLSVRFRRWSPWCSKEILPLGLPLGSPRRIGDGRIGRWPRRLRLRKCGRDNGGSYRRHDKYSHADPILNELCLAAAASGSWMSSTTWRGSAWRRSPTPRSRRNRRARGRAMIRSLNDDYGPGKRCDLRRSRHRRISDWHLTL